MALLSILVIFTLLCLAQARTVGDREHTISKLNYMKILATGSPVVTPSTAPPTPAGFVATNPPTNGPTGSTGPAPTCSASAFTQTGTFTNNGATFVATFTQTNPSVGALVWVDLHVSKNCQLSAAAQLGQCATPWYQEPFDQDYALNLHASADANAYSSSGASFNNGVFTFTVGLAPVGLSASDVFCYAFTYDYPSFACQTDICTVGTATAAPTSPATIAPSTPAGFALPTGTAASVCSILQYTQSATYTNGNFVASFTPINEQPVYVDLHVTKNCPGAGPSTGQCPTPFVQVPYYDEPYAYNFHDAANGADTDPTVATFTNGTFYFNFQNTKITLGAGEYLCYGFTYTFDYRLQCEIGSCTP